MEVFIPGQENDFKVQSVRSRSKIIYPSLASSPKDQPNQQQSSNTHHRQGPFPHLAEIRGDIRVACMATRVSRAQWFTAFMALFDHSLCSSGLTLSFLAVSIPHAFYSNLTRMT